MDGVDKNTRIVLLSEKIIEFVGIVEDTILKDLQHKDDDELELLLIQVTSLKSMAIIILNQIK